jgi:hypothetical protein
MPNALLVDHIRDYQSSWSCGRFGAIAEFHRGRDEAVEISTGPTLSAVTARGAIRIECLAELRPLAYETVGKEMGSWGQGVALCLPRSVARMSGRTVVTELGPDESALRPQDRAMTLFDLGLGGTQAEVCVRTGDPQAIALLRSACGRSIQAQPDILQRLPTLNPHRVFCSRLGRIEVYQGIPSPDGKTPEGPHTHVLPRLLASGRYHAATVPVPEGWMAGMSLFPAHPLMPTDGQAPSFDRARFDAFQSIMRRYGDPELLAGKQAAFTPGADVDGSGGERGRALGFRIGQRQSKWLQDSGLHGSAMAES